MKINNIVGHRLKTLRKRNKLTQNDIAKLLNCSQNAIFSYENGINEPPLKVLKFYSDYFNVSYDYLFGKSNKKNFSNNDTHEDIKSFIEYCFTPESGEIYEEIKSYIYKIIDRGMNID